MTTHKVLRIPVADLTLLRLTCAKCGASIEIPTSEVSRRLRNTDCSFCNASLFATGRQSPAIGLALAIEEVLQDAESVTVEFVVPVEE